MYAHRPLPRGQALCRFSAPLLLRPQVGARTHSPARWRISTGSPQSARAARRSAGKEVRIIGSRATLLQTLAAASSVESTSKWRPTRFDGVASPFGGQRSCRGGYTAVRKRNLGCLDSLVARSAPTSLNWVASCVYTPRQFLAVASRLPYAHRTALPSSRALVHPFPCSSVSRRKPASPMVMLSDGLPRGTISRPTTTP